MLKYIHSYIIYTSFQYINLKIVVKETNKINMFVEQLSFLNRTL